MSTTGHENEVVRVSGLKATMKKGGNLGIFNKGTCTTAAATAAKEVTVGAAFTLTDGATVLVRFTYGITAADATLSVNSGTAKPIYYRGAALPAGLVHAKDTLLLKYNSSQWDVVGELDTTYESKAAASGGSDVSLVTTGEKAVWNAKQDALGAGTAQLLTTGTDTAERTWQAKIIADYVKANGNNLLDLMALSHDYVFKKRDCIAIDAALYRCTAETTEEPPFDFVFDDDNNIVIEEINGQEAVVCDNDTLNTGWEKVLDLSDRFYVEQVRQEINQAKQDKLTFDGVPTSGSLNPVTSNGIHSALYNLPWKVVKKESVGGSAVTPGDSIGPGVMIYITNITTTNNLQLEYTEGVAARWNIVVTFGAAAWFYITFSRSGLQELLSLQGDVDVQSNGSVMIEVYFDGENFYYDMFVLYKA